MNRWHGSPTCPMCQRLPSLSSRSASLLSSLVYYIINTDASYYRKGQVLQMFKTMKLGYDEPIPRVGSHGLTSLLIDEPRTLWTMILNLTILCVTVESVHTFDGTVWGFESWQCRIYIISRIHRAHTIIWVLPGFSGWLDTKTMFQWKLAEWAPFIDLDFALCRFRTIDFDFAPCTFWRFSSIDLANCRFCRIHLVLYLADFAPLIFILRLADFADFAPSILILHLVDFADFLPLISHLADFVPLILIVHRADFGILHHWSRTLKSLHHWSWVCTMQILHHWIDLAHCWFDTLDWSGFAPCTFCTIRWSCIFCLADLVSCISQTLHLVSRRPRVLYLEDLVSWRPCIFSSICLCRCLHARSQGADWRAMIGLPSGASVSSATFQRRWGGWYDSQVSHTIHMVSDAIHKWAMRFTGEPCDSQVSYMRFMDESCDSHVNRTIHRWARLLTGEPCDSQVSHAIHRWIMRFME